MQEMKTPDHTTFSIGIVSKGEADSMESECKGNGIDDPRLTTYKRFAGVMNNGKVLYRQFIKGIGFIFPSREEFDRGFRGKTYWEVSFLPTDDENNDFVEERNFTRIATSYGLMPALANDFRKDIAEELTAYEPFEGNRFYKLKDGAVIMLRVRTSQLSDGWWFPSLRDFDFYYYVYSGKERPSFPQV